MDFLLEALTNWLKEMLVGGIMSNLSGMFDSVNQQVADISVQVGQTPQEWNGSIFNMIENLSNSIMVPIRSRSKCHCCFIIDSVHDYMGMTFSEHCFRLLFLSVFPVMHFFQKK